MLLCLTLKLIIYHFFNFPVKTPYGGSAEEYQQLFRKNFIIKTLAPCYNSIERRISAEVFINLMA